jgi:GNAT superfamily N-acetyltransferase
VRPRTPADLPAAYGVFRRSLFDYLYRVGALKSPAISDAEIARMLVIARPVIEHFANTAAEDWVAEDETGQIIGWSQSVERDGVLYLTMFFVDPQAQSNGVGRALIDAALPAERGRARIIDATQDPRALSLYLRSGVRFVSTSVAFRGTPEPSEIPTDLDIERLLPAEHSAAKAILFDIEREVLGHGRIEEIQYLLEDRPVFVARRGGRVVGMAFGASRTVPARDKGRETGPMCALDPADMPALIACVENDAVANGISDLGFTIPMVNSTAVSYVLARRYRIDPFYTFILASDDRMRLDRWIQMQPEAVI